MTVEGGQPVVRHFDPEPSTDGAALQWLDSEAGQPGPVLHFGIRRTASSETVLEGGRWLRGKRSVLDVHTLQLMRYDGWPAPAARRSRRPGST